MHHYYVLCLSIPSRSGFFNSRIGHVQTIGLILAGFSYMISKITMKQKSTRRFSINTITAN